jgi:hypothetical protein
MPLLGSASLIPENGRVNDVGGSQRQYHASQASCRLGCRLYLLLLANSNHVIQTKYALVRSNKLAKSETFHDTRVGLHKCPTEDKRLSRCVSKFYEA